MTSISDFPFAKDTAEPVFFFRETDTKFILTARLKGYKRKNIKIKISEDGSELSVNGEKAVKEMRIMPLMIKEEKEMKMRGFEKKFKIPEGVVLDGIKASYDEEDWMLTIVMPRMAKGIEEVKEEEIKEEEVDKGRTEEEEEEEEPGPSVVEKVKKEEEVVEEKGRPEEAAEQRVRDEVPKKTEEEKTSQEIKKKRPRKPKKPCFPLVFGGSTFLLSLIFLVIHYIRLKQK